MTAQAVQVYQCRKILESTGLRCKRVAKGPVRYYCGLHAAEQVEPVPANPETLQVTHRDVTRRRFGVVLDFPDRVTYQSVLVPGGSTFVSLSELEELLDSEDGYEFGGGCSFGMTVEWALVVNGFARYRTRGGVVALTGDDAQPLIDLVDHIHDSEVYRTGQLPEGYDLAAILREIRLWMDTESDRMVVRHLGELMKAQGF